MVAAVYLVTRTIQGRNQDINQVREAIVHEDDAQTDAQIIAALIASMNAQEPAGDPSGAQDQYPANYFDTVVQIGASPAGPLATDGDFIVYHPEVSSLKT
jgi:hypothetical protein